MLRVRIVGMAKIPNEIIHDIEVMGLNGREIIINNADYPDKNFLYIGGQHNLLEKLYPVADFLSDFGSVYFPDTPGFGGMDSFAKIDKPINIDSYADYLHQYILQKDLRNIWLSATSISTLFVIRLLQKYPELHPRIDNVLALVGLSHARDFAIPAHIKLPIIALCKFAQFSIGSKIAHAIGFNRYSFKILLWLIRKNHSKFNETKPEEIDQHMKTEAKCWTSNDHQTHAKSTLFMFNADLESDQQDKIPFTMHNVAVSSDQYFDQDRMNTSMNNLFSGYKVFTVQQDAHSPADLGTKAGLQQKMPAELIEFLKS